MLDAQAAIQTVDPAVAIAAAIAAASAQASASTAVTVAIITAVSSVLSLIITTIGGGILAIMAKSKLDSQANGIDKIHTAVNSERTAMIATIEKLRDEILELTKSKVKAEQATNDMTAAAAAAAAAKDEPDKEPK